MELTKERADYLAQLLHDSPVSDELKSTILGSLDKMSDEAIDNLILSLENERLMINQTVKDLGDFESQQKKDWADLEQKQIGSVDEIVERVIAELENSN